MQQQEKCTDEVDWKLNRWIIKTIANLHFFVRMNNLKIIVLCKERNSKKSFFGIHLIIIITCFMFIRLLLPFHICYLILKHKLSFIVHFIHQYHLKARVLPQKMASKKHVKWNLTFRAKQCIAQKQVLFSDIKT